MKNASNRWNSSDFSLHRNHHTVLLTEEEFDNLITFLPRDISIAEGLRRLIFSRLEDGSIKGCPPALNYEKRTHTVLLNLTDEEEAVFMQYRRDYGGKSIGATIRSLIFEKGGINDIRRGY